MTYIDQGAAPGGTELHWPLVTPGLGAELGHPDLVQGAALPGEGGAPGGRGVAAHLVPAHLLLHSLAAHNIVLNLRHNPLKSYKSRRLSTSNEHEREKKETVTNKCLILSQ